MQKFDSLVNKISAELKKIIQDDLKSPTDLQEARNIFLGSKSELRNTYLKNMKNFNNSEKKHIGDKVKQLNNFYEQALQEKQELFLQKFLNEKMKAEAIDVTLRKEILVCGNNHPLNNILYEVNKFFKSLGYTILSGQEAEQDVYNFEKLNIPKNHPAREMQDSFYINNHWLLRTHCTNMTARYLAKFPKNKPMKVVSTGNVFRNDDDDRTHSHQFTQIDAVNTGTNVSLPNLKWTLEKFVEHIFGHGSKIRMRPSFFPFTEVSMEVDVACFKCKGKGCSFCKHTGWIEILGAGMLHPNVIKACNHDPKIIQGFAFGIGVERIAMLKYEIEDIRDFYTNDIRFLSQFKEF